jgi:N-acetylglucosaminyldiphosphoundecaprenol N-acetyl-beta-D-mannosaminyltransferase
MTLVDMAVKAGVPKSTRHSILGVRFDFVDYRSAFETMLRWRRARARQYVTIANPRDVQLCRSDAQFRAITAGSGLTLPDGVGIVLAARILGYGSYGRATGPALMLNVCDWGRQFGLRHYLYGGNDGVPEKLAGRLSRLYPGIEIAGAYSPPFRPLSADEDRAVVDEINSTLPDVVWVGLGAPKQEKWVASHLGRIDAPVMIGVGAAFDFHSGNCRWAPSWVRRAGMEWLWRLMLEPGRMWRRNLAGLAFAARVVARGLSAGRAVQGA